MAYKQSPGRMNMPKTGRGIDSVALMTGETSPLMNFPIKKGTKLNENERVAVNIMGQETMFSNLAEARSKLAAHRKTNPTADVGERGSITGYTVTSKDKDGKEIYTEQRNPVATDAKSGSKRTETEQATLDARSKAKPQGEDQRSAQLQKDGKGIESRFTVSKDENNTSIRKYKS